MVLSSFELDQRLALIRMELSEIKRQRQEESLNQQITNARNHLEHKCDQLEEAFMSAQRVRMNEYYNRSEQPLSSVLMQQSRLLSAALLMKARRTQLKIATEQNKGLVTYMMCVKFVMEDEKDTIEAEMRRKIDIQKQQNSLLRQRYEQKIRIQHSIVTRLESKINDRNEFLKKAELLCLDQKVPGDHSFRASVLSISKRAADITAESSQFKSCGAPFVEAGSTTAKGCDSEPCKWTRCTPKETQSKVHILNPVDFYEMFALPLEMNQAAKDPTNSFLDYHSSEDSFSFAPVDISQSSTFDIEASENSVVSVPKDVSSVSLVAVE